MRRLLIAALLFTPCVTLPLQRLTPPEPIALIHGNVVNVRNGQVTPDATVIIRGGRIESIRSAGPAPGGISIIDLNGKYLLPGLIDAHTHASDFAAMRRALESGVTTVRSAGVSLSLIHI